MYSQHWRSFLAGVPPPASPCFVQRGRYVAPSVRWCIHKFWYISMRASRWNQTRPAMTPGYYTSGLPAMMPCIPQRQVSEIR
jgi:hypothetical protein